MVRLQCPSGLIVTVSFDHGRRKNATGDGYVMPKIPTTIVTLTTELKDDGVFTISETAKLHHGDQHCYYKSRYYVLRKLFKALKSRWPNFPLTGSDKEFLLTFFATKMFVQDKTIRKELRERLDARRLPIVKEPYVEAPTPAV